MARRYQQLIVLILLLWTLIVPCITIFTTPQPALAEDSSGLLTDSELVSGNDMSGCQFSGMQVSINSGSVTASHSFQLNTKESASQDKNSIHVTFGTSGWLDMTMQGTYSADSGMSGKYTLSFDGTVSLQGQQAPYKIDHDGTFSNPEKMIDGQPYTVSFSGGAVTNKLTDTTEGSIEPFRIRFTAVKDEEDIKFAAMNGQIEVKYEGENDWHLCKLGTKLEKNAMVRSFEDSTAILSFSDTSTYILQPETTVVLESPPDKPSKLALIAGKIWLNIKKIAKNGSMEIEMTQAICGIKGTTFVCEETGSKSTIKVIESTVTVTSRTTGKSVDVAAGKMVTATSAGLGQISSFDVKAEQAKWEAAGSSSSQSKPQSSSTGKPNTTSQSGTSTKKNKSACFIATAAYGSETAKELDTLRAFRDKVLLKSQPGKWFVETYYQVSPPLAEFIAECEEVRTIVRESILDPIVNLLKHTELYWNN